MKFLIFGTGEYYSRYKIWFRKNQVLALIDNAKEKQGQFIDGIPVIRPENISRYDFDAVVILSFYVRAMRSQLVSLGVAENKIYHFFDLHDLIYTPAIKRPVQCYGSAQYCGSAQDYESVQYCGLAQDYQSAQDYESVRYYGTVQGEAGILLLSQDLTLGGPALALYHAAQVLVKKGYRPVYGSMMDGPLREILTAEGIPVIVDENLMVRTMRETEWISGFSHVICNTMNFHVFLSDRDIRIPAAWWLHDALFFYDGANRKALERIRADHMKIWSVGPIPEKAIQTLRPDFCVQSLLYGVIDQSDMKNKEDMANQADRTDGAGMGGWPDRTDMADRTGGTDQEGWPDRSDMTDRSGWPDKESGTDKAGLEKADRTDAACRVRFTVIGYIEYRKGQDILLEAIRSLNPDIRQHAEFFFVGQNTSVMAKEIMEKAAGIPEITITGPVDRKAIDHILRQTDMLVCPSREDPMPTVAAEAMMHGVPCLVSDAAGTARYIKNGRDGFVFRSEDADQLKELIERCILDRPVWMGRNARRIYEEYFSMEAFEKRFMSLFKELG